MKSADLKGLRDLLDKMGPSGQSAVLVVVDENARPQISAIGNQMEIAYMAEAIRLMLHEAMTGRIPSSPPDRPDLKPV